MRTRQTKAKTKIRKKCFRGAGREMRVRTDLVDRGAHFVELVRAYVRAICEAKVDQTLLPEQVLLRERLALMG